MHIITGGLEVSVATAFNQLGFVAAAQDVAVQAMAVIEPELATVASTHEMKHRAGVLNAELARHTTIKDPGPEPVNTKKQTKGGVDPGSIVSAD
jgi:hypothetical protein